MLTGNYNGFFGKLFYKNKLKDLEKTLETLKNKFKDRLYLEIQRHGEFQEKNFENYLLSISKSLQLPLIATQEIFYIDKEMYDAHDALICIGEKNFIDDKNRLRYSDQHYFKSQKEVEKLYSDIPEALENNYNFHLRFNFKPKKSRPILPSIANDQSGSPEDQLMQLAKKGLVKRLENFILKKDKSKSKEQIKKIYEDRLAHEINIINSMNYASYFLIVSDYIKWAKKSHTSWPRQRIWSWIIGSLLFRYNRFGSNRI